MGTSLWQNSAQSGTGVVYASLLQGVRREVPDLFQKRYL